MNPDSSGRTARHTAETLPLPAGRHLPGLNPRPRDGFLEEIAHQAPPVASMAAIIASPAWWYGLRLIREGYFWEAHEVLEPFWMHAQPNSGERSLVQGLIQLANGYLKSAMGKPGAAVRLGKIAAGLFHGVDVRTAAALGISLPDCLAACRNLQDARMDATADIAAIFF